MVKVFDFTNIFKNKVEKIGNSFNESLVFVEPSDYSKEEEYFYKSITVLDSYANDINQYNFPFKVKLVNASNSGSTFYYGHINSCTDSSVEVHIRRLDLVSFHDKKVHSVEVDITEQDQPIDYVALNSKIIGINERYCLLFIPNKKIKYGKPYFSNCFLIDSFENKMFTVQNDFNNDSLLRLQDIWVIDNGESLIIKTGRIQEFEKRERWEEAHTKEITLDYFDQNETLYILNTKMFIQQVRDDEKLTFTIIDSSNYESGFSIIGLYLDKFAFIKRTYKEMKTMLNFYTISSAELEKKEITSPFDSIFSTSENYYLVELIEAGKVNIQSMDFSKNMIFQMDDAGIISVDDNNIITIRYNEKFEKIINIYNFHSEKLINTYTVRDYYFDSEQDILIFY
ncbi:hypothetical protein [Paenibacillus sp. BAC0078]